MSTSNQLTVGKASVQSNFTTWPNSWQWPTYVYPTVTYTPNRGDEYANEVEVEQNEHDATIHFYRSDGPRKGKTLIKTITVPLSLLKWLQGEEG